MNAVAHLQIIGCLMASLVAIGFVVPRRYRWEDEMQHLSLLNRQIFRVHNAFIMLLLALFAALLLTSADALLEPSRLARAMLLGLTAFWGMRLWMQFFYYSPRLWRGKVFETVVHIVFSFIWFYFTAVFGTLLWRNLNLA
jgi:hypothetical protein